MQKFALFDYFQDTRSKTRCLVPMLVVKTILVALTTTTQSKTKTTTTTTTKRTVSAITDWSDLVDRPLYLPKSGHQCQMYDLFPLLKELLKGRC